MSAATDNFAQPPAGPTDRPPPAASQGDGLPVRCMQTGPDDCQAERFRATARRIAVQLDIEETMWRMLGKEPERP